MAELRSFKDVIANEFYNIIWDVIFKYVEDNPDRLDCHSYLVNQPDEAELSDLNITRVDVTDSTGDEILFDVIVSAGIIISETVRRNRETDDVEQWFRVSCRGDLNNGLRNFSIFNVSTYSREPAGKMGRLSDALVPIIAKEQFDEVAEAFLREYYPEALVTPMPVPVREVASKMGLTIKELRLSRHFTLFGAMVFNDCTIEYFSAEEREYKSLDVKRGTILVDPDVYFMRCVGCWNNTVIHECVHWYKHRKYHELTGMYDSDAARISCQVHESGRHRRDWTPTDWMEWHANGIAPRILMPKAVTVQKIEELIHENTIILGANNRLDIMESVIFELAEFFQVSRTAAKIRMLDLGYKEVEGVYTYVDDHYISSYAFDADSKNSNQTYSISLSDSFFEYFSNPFFRRLIDSGNFTYLDGHYVINDPKYIKRSVLGGISLTDYAKMHIDECCIRFDLKYNVTAKTDVVIYLDFIEFRKATPNYNRVPAFNVDNHNMEVFNRSEELKKLHKEYIEEGQFLSTPAGNFAQVAYAHIQRKGYNKAVFCDKTLLSGKTFDRIKDNRLPNPTLETVMQICIGLELGGIYGEQLLEIAGYKLNNSPQQLAYKKLLHSYYGHSIYECDEVLRALGLASIVPKAYRETAT